jgi:hypothetical protein
MDSATIIHYVVSVIYYVLVIIMAILSAFGIYVFIRYGKTVMLTMIVSLAYIVLFIALLAGSYRLLGSV